MNLMAIKKTNVGARLGRSDILWRYLDAAKFMDFLHNKTLYFSRGDQFEDKFEGSFTQSIRHAIELSYKTNNIAFTYEEFRQRIRERVFVNCWHRSPDDSIAMWNLYGKSACSVAITTTIGKLKKTIEDQHLAPPLSIERVQYVKHWRDPKLNINPYSRVFAYKVKAYEHEKEVRVIMDRSIAEFEASVTELGMSVPVSHKTLLRSIVIAPEAPLWFESLVRDLVNKYEISAPVNRSKLAVDPL